MNLVVDYGNSAAKVGIFDHQNLMEKQSFHDAAELRQFLNSYNANHLIISSVNTDAAEIASWSHASGLKLVLHHSLPLPINNLYKTPATLGVDRVAAVCGAQQLFPFNNCLVIDAGTCITFDFIDKENNYHGGAISPGLKMRFQAVHTFTARLPLITAIENPKLVGDSTETCIQSGVINGIVAELEGTIDQYRVKFGELQVILCGGDARFFENKVKASIFASPDLVLVGLNSILIYNVNR
jgi:type III pantothenate kinase